MFIGNEMTNASFVDLNMMYSEILESRTKEEVLQILLKIFCLEQTPLSHIFNPRPYKFNRTYFSFPSFTVLKEQQVHQQPAIFEVMRCDNLW